MEISKKKKIFNILKIVGINLIPVVGVLFFDWGIFELVFIFLVEAEIALLVSYFDHYYISGRSKMDLGIIFIQTINILVMLVGMLVFWGLLIFIVTNDFDIQDSKANFKLFSKDFEFGWIILVLFILNTLSYIINKQYKATSEDSPLWENLRELFYIHAFISIISIIYGVLPHNTFTGLLLFIGLKVFIEYWIKDALFRDNIKRIFKPKSKK